MTARHATTGDDDALVAAYEELRNHVLAGAGHGNPFGLILLLREGIAAWMDRASARCVPAASPHPDRPGAAPMVTDEIHVGMARVLASIVLAGRGEASP